MAEIENWLDKQGLGKYASMFVDNEIEIDDLVYLSEEDLEKLGLPMGPRKRLLAAVQGARRQSTQPTAISDPETGHRPTTGTETGAEHRQLTVMFADLVGSVELALLEDRWTKTREGHGQIVLIGAEPGVGKSRLLHEFRQKVRTDPHVSIALHCSPYQINATLFPVIDVIERQLKLVKDAGDVARLDALEKWLDALSLSPADYVPLLAALLEIPFESRYAALDLSAEVRRRRTLEALVRLIEVQVVDKPMLLIAEDLHWVDPTTEMFLGRIVEIAKNSPINMLLTQRPEYLAPWGSEPHLTEVRLNHLTRNECRSLIGNIAAAAGLSESLMENIAERTDGVPLFVEELSKAIVEAQDFDAIPASLRDALTSRLDLLGSAKDVAQAASVLGREFSSFLGKRQEAWSYCEKALWAGRESGDRQLIATALVGLSLEDAFTERFRQVLDRNEEALALFSEQSSLVWEADSALSRCLLALGLAAVRLGEVHKARETLVRVAEIRERLPRTFSEHETAVPALVGIALGEWDAVIVAVEQELRDGPSPFHDAALHYFLSCAVLGRGDVDRAVPMLDEGLKKSERYRSEQVQLRAAVALGEAYCDAGRLDDAQDVAVNCKERAQRNEIPDTGAVLLQGRIALQHGELDRAYELISVADKAYASREMKPHRARCRCLVALVASGKNNQNEASEHLQYAHRIYVDMGARWFVEETRSLAKQLGLATRFENIEGHLDPT